MTEQELHRLSRKDLLELMLQQAKEIEEIKKPDAKPVRKQEKKSSIHLTR